MVAIVTSIILLATTPTPLPARVTLNDLVGMWITVRGDCRDGQHLLSANGDYRMWCFDSISEGKWFLRGQDKIVVRYDPKKSDEQGTRATWNANGFSRKDYSQGACVQPYARLW